MKHVEVQQALRHRREEVLAKAQEVVELTTERVMRSLEQALFFDPRKLYHRDGTVKAIHELDEATALALTGIEVTEVLGAAKGEAPNRQGRERTVTARTVKFKWLDKTAAREHAMRTLGLFEKDNRQRTDPLAELIAQINKQRSSLPIVEQDVG